MPYIQQVLAKLNIAKYFSKILSREDCTALSESVTIKSIDKSLRNSSNTILIDNSICSFATQPYNGVYISAFNGNNKDNELLKLGQFLLQLHKSKDMKTALYESGYNLGDVIKCTLA